MARYKANRYVDLENYPNVYQGFGTVPLESIFGSVRPLTLELACGRGEYTNGLAKVYPERNFLGIDIKGERLWQGARRTRELALTNTAFGRVSIDLLEKQLPAHSVEEMWIVHPDPQPKRARQRLTHPKYLKKYVGLLAGEGVLRLKTDDLEFYNYSLRTLPEYFKITAHTVDLHASELLEEHHGITTNFEHKALADRRTIKYLRARKK